MRGEVPTIRPDVQAPRGDAEWFAQSVEYYADNDAAQSGTIGSGQETWMQTTVVGPGNISFYYKMSSVSGDALAFYVDESFKASWGQGSSWPWTGNFAVPSGPHTLKWKYYKYSGSTAGSCWIDAIQWSGGVPASGGGADWEQITYTYDPSGRRIAKDVDGVVTKYVYDGDQCIAEYDGSNNLLRKYVYGPGIDQPICMIEVADANAAYFYHYDALGSVVALSDADGDTVQVYEYDVYGQVAASDPNHPNRFMFTGREFDSETGLYYYRARYYNPAIGRFLQTDPIGYEGGMGLYAYCTNNPWNVIDPFGLKGNCIVWDPRLGCLEDCCDPGYAAAHPGECGVPSAPNNVNGPPSACGLPGCAGTDYGIDRQIAACRDQVDAWVDTTLIGADFACKVFGQLVGIAAGYGNLVTRGLRWGTGVIRKLGFSFGIRNPVLGKALGGLAATVGGEIVGKLLSYLSTSDLAEAGCSVVLHLHYGNVRQDGYKYCDQMGDYCHGLGPAPGLPGGSGGYYGNHGDPWPYQNTGRASSWGSQFAKASAD